MHCQALMNREAATRLIPIEGFSQLLPGYNLATDFKTPRFAAGVALLNIVLNLFDVVLLNLKR